MKKIAQYDHAYLIHRPDHLPIDFPVDTDFDRFLCGLFLPQRDAGRLNKSAYSARIVLLFQDRVAVVAHPATGDPPVDVRLNEILAIEHRRVYPDATITVRTSGDVQKWSYDLHGEGFVGEFLFQLRQILLTDEETTGRASRATFGEPLDHKFGCGESDNLDRSEPLIARFFSAPTTLVEKRWFLKSKTTVAGEYLALTPRRALWLSDQIDDNYEPRGIMSRFAPLRQVADIEVQRQDGACEIVVTLFGGIHWKLPIQSGFCGEAESFAKQAYRFIERRDAKKRA